MPAIAPPRGGFNGNVPNEYWKLPLNWWELNDAVKWASKDNITLEVDSPDFIVAELLKQKNTGRYMLHLINYRVNNECTDIGIKLRLPENNDDFDITLYSPDIKSPVSLSPDFIDNELSFTVPALDTYNLIVIELK